MAFGWRQKARRSAAGADALPEASNYVAEGAELSGELRFRASVRLDGRVEGEVRADGTVIVGPSAEIHASVFAESVIVFGSVEGDIRARRKIALYKSSRVRGELSSAGITIEEGASFKGSIAIGDDEAPALLPAAAPPGAAQAPSDG